MPDIADEKRKIRTLVNSKKKEKTDTELDFSSEKILSFLESMDAFKESHNIFIYRNLPDEVRTSSFIEKWKDKKNIYLPFIKGDDIIFRKYTTDVPMATNSYGISEPVCNDFLQYDNVTLIVVPGMAFDASCNRLGRGKGYYDRLLPKLKCPKVGICFEFQFFATIPAEPHDIKMDYVVTEKGMRARIQKNYP